MWTLLLSNSGNVARIQIQNAKDKLNLDQIPHGGTTKWGLRKNQKSKDRQGMAAWQSVLLTDMKNTADKSVFGKLTQDRDYQKEHYA